MSTKFIPVSSLSDPGGPEYVVDGLIEAGTLTCILGASKAGKSTFAMQLSFCVQNQIPLLGIDCNQKDVLYVDLELRKSVIKRRYDLLLKQHPEVTDPKAYELLSLRDESLRTTFTDVWLFEQIKEAMRENPNVGLVVIDDYYRIPGGVSHNAANTLRILGQLEELTAINKAAVCYVHHTSNRETHDIMNKASGSCMHSRYVENFILVEAFDDVMLRGNNASISIKGSAIKSRTILCDKSGSTGFFDALPALPPEEELKITVENAMASGTTSERTLHDRYGVTTAQLREWGYDVDTKTHTVSKPEEPNPEEPVTIKQVPTKAEASDKKKPVLSVVNGGKKY